MILELDLVDLLISYKRTGESYSRVKDATFLNGLIRRILR